MALGVKDQSVMRIQKATQVLRLPNERISCINEWEFVVNNLESKEVEIEHLTLSQVQDDAALRDQYLCILQTNYQLTVIKIGSYKTRITF